MNIKMDISARNLDVLLNEFVQDKNGNDVYISDEFSIEAKERYRPIGALPAPETLTLVLSLSSSFAISLFANWVFDKFKEKSKEFVTIKIGNIIIRTKDDLIIEMEKDSNN